MASDLEKTLRVAEQMKRDYEVLKASYNKMKVDHTALQEQYHEAKNAAELAIQSKQSVERECEQLYVQWNEHLKSQADEFSDLQSQMVPARELEMMRVQLTEELEHPHRQQIETLTGEINRYRESYFKEHRELALLQTNYQLLQQEAKSAVEQEKAENAQTIQELQTKCAKLQALVEDETLATKFRAAERSNADLSLRLKQAREEMEDLRQERENVVVEKEESYLKHLNQLKLESGKLQLLEKSLAASVRRGENLAQDLKQEQAERMLLQERVLALEQDKREMSATLATERRQAEGQITRQEQRYSEATAKHNDELNRMQKQLEHTQGLVRQAEDGATKLREQLTIQERESAKALQQIQEDNNKDMFRMESAKKDLYRELTEVRQTTSTQQSEMHAQMECLRLEVETLRTTKRGMEQERERLMLQCDEKVASYNDIVRDSQARMTQFQELQTEFETLQVAHRALTEREAKAKEELSDTRRQMDLTKMESDNITRDLVDERTTHLLTLQQNQDIWSQEKERLEAMVRDQEQRYNELQHQSEQRFQRCRSEKNKYKLLSQKLKALVEQSQQENASHQRISQKNLQSRKAQIHTLAESLKLTEKQRDQLLSQINILSTSSWPAGTASAMASGTASPSGIYRSPATSPLRSTSSRGNRMNTTAPPSVFSQSFLSEQRATTDRISKLRRQLGLMGVEADVADDRSSTASSQQ